MLAEEDEEDSDPGVREFFSLSTGEIHRLILPEASKTRCFSSQGWLMTVDEKVKATLLHPLSRVQIQLPGLDAFPNHAAVVNDNDDLHVISKFVLSTPSPDDSDLVVMVVWIVGGYRMGFCRPGDSSWTIIDELHPHRAILDITYHDGKLYAMDALGNVLVCHVHGRSPTTLLHVFSLPAKFYRCTDVQGYLVELLGKLLIIYRKLKTEWAENTLEIVSYSTTKFEVFEANLSDGECAQVKSLGDKALFLGYNSSFFVDPLSTDTISCKSNCIYFTDDNFECYLRKRGGAMDMGIYSLSDGSFEVFFNRTSFSRITPPTWVQPNFYLRMNHD